MRTKRISFLVKPKDFSENPSVTCAMKEAKTMTQLHLPSGCSPSSEEVDKELEEKLSDSITSSILAGMKSSRAATRSERVVRARGDALRTVMITERREERRGVG